MMPIGPSWACLSRVSERPAGSLAFLCARGHLNALSNPLEANAGITDHDQFLLGGTKSYESPTNIADRGHS